MSIFAVFKNVSEQKESSSTVAGTKDEDDPANDSSPESKVFTVKILYTGKEGEGIVKSLKHTIKRNIPDNQKIRAVQKRAELSKYFNIKDKIDGRHLSNFMYYKTGYRNKKCKKGDYVEETARRRIVRAREHAGKDKDSLLLKHSASTKHPKARAQDFEVLATNYPDCRKRMLAEAMFIRD